MHHYSSEMVLVLGAGAVRKGSLSHSLSIRLIPAGAWVHGDLAFLYTFKISIALTIRSLDPRWGF